MSAADPTQPRYVIGVDTGGTFTDIVVLDADGTITTDKAFSTPARPAEGVLAALDAVAARLGLDRRGLLTRTRRLVHGTTVSTNALITRRGARVGLLTTRGFEDTLGIGRGPMGRTGGLPYQQAMDFAGTSTPPPLVPRTLIRGLDERVDRDGRVLVPADPDEVRARLAELVAAGADSLAVCLLWAFANPAAEQLVREVAAAEHPDLPVSLSSEVSPTLGEFERMSTTVVNAYVGGITSAYIDQLSRALRADGLAPPIELMKASGGCCLPADIAREAAALINSGPVGGMVGARALAPLLGTGNLITTDMGGTSFDVGLIRDGQMETEALSFADQGIPVRTAAVRLEAVGAGGGSIAWTDGIRLRVGPHSAGADPGPACYGLGGSEPTVTDALVVLGILDPGYFFGGRYELQPELAAEAIRTRVAEPLGLSVLDAAAGIVEIVGARMADLVRKVTVESGFDPRDFTLLCYGGAGPAHCADYGGALGVAEIVIPTASPVFSALGVALSDLRYASVRSELLAIDDVDKQNGADVFARAAEIFADLEAAARADVAATRGPDAPVEIIRKVDIRYRGQLNDLTIPWDPKFLGTSELADGDVAAVRSAFNAEYAARFGKEATRDAHPLELTAYRLEIVQPSEISLELQSAALPTDSPTSPTPSSSRQVYVRGRGHVPTAVFRSEDVQPGHRLAGPCLIERPDTTVYVPDGFGLRVDAYGNFRITRTDGGAR